MLCRAVTSGWFTAWRRAVRSLGDQLSAQFGDDGYFLLLASPEVKAADAQPQPKTVIFVIDRSGSMAGKKIEQAQEGAEIGAQQSPRGRPVQHHRLR